MILFHPELNPSCLLVDSKQHRSGEERVLRFAPCRLVDSLSQLRPLSKDWSDGPNRSHLQDGRRSQTWRSGEGNE